MFGACSTWGSLCRASGRSCESANEGRSCQTVRQTPLADSRARRVFQRVLEKERLECAVRVAGGFQVSLLRRAAIESDRGGILTGRSQSEPRSGRESVRTFRGCPNKSGLLHDPTPASDRAVPNSQSDPCRGASRDRLLGWCHGTSTPPNPTCSGLPGYGRKRRERAMLRRPPRLRR